VASKPKAADYKPSEAEKASASVAMAEYQYFKEKYDPLLQEMRDKSLTEDVQSGLRGRANADVMQALSAPSYEAATSSTVAGDTAQALTGQLGAANVAANQVQNTMQSGVLGTARGQAADAQSGMAQASRLATSSALEKARANQQVALAKQSAAGQVAGAFIAKAAENKASGGTLFTPKDPKTGLSVSSVKDRLFEHCAPAAFRPTVYAYISYSGFKTRWFSWLCFKYAKSYSVPTNSCSGEVNNGRLFNVFFKPRRNAAPATADADYWRHPEQFVWWSHRSL
jgi:hypothetical protein